MIVGVDVRDHTILTVRANDEGRVVKRDRRPATPDAVIGSLRAVGAHEVAAVGIAVRDPIHSSSELSTAVRAAGLAVTPHLVRHGAATAIAEHWCGAARGATSVVALNVDEGVDAGIVIDGRVIEGSHGLAGRAGWLALHPVEREDYRRLGCLEAEVGAPGIVRRLIWRIKAGDESRVLELAGGDFSAVTLDHIFTAARSGDGVAVSIVRDTVRYLGMAVANLVALLDPEIVVLGGTVAAASDLLLAASTTEASRRLPATPNATWRLVAGSLGQDGVALGAARAAMLAA